MERIYKMKTYIAPQGKAGTDVLYGIEKSIESHLKRMFEQGTQRNVLKYRVDPSTGREDIVRFRSQVRECDAATTFHAGRAVDLALQLVHAVVTDRILGRKYPHISEEENRLAGSDRSSHNLSDLHEKILQEFQEHEGLSRNDLENALEHAYQTALNKGMVDLTVDDRNVGQIILLSENLPFYKKSDNSITDGVEKTNHYGNVGTLFSSQTLSEFEDMPFGTFKEFLQKADKSYYGTNNTRYNDYAYRDHETGRPYYVAGMDLFARLTKELVSLYQQPKIWHPEFASRFFERKNDNIKQKVDTLIIQNFVEKFELPAMISPQDQHKGHLY